MDPRHQHKQESSVFPAIILSLVAVIGWQYYQSTQQSIQPDTQIEAEGSVPGAPEMQTSTTSAITPSDQPLTTKRISVMSDTLTGSIALTGGRLDALSLNGYFEEKNSAEHVTLFAPDGEEAHFFDAGWQSMSTPVPSGNTAWQANQNELTRDLPLILSWDNGQGQIFTRTFKMPEDGYLITVEDKIFNQASQPVSVGHYAQIHKSFSGKIGAEDMGTFYNELGPMAVVDDLKYEYDYDHVKDHGRIKEQGIQGWIGIKSQYFMAALVPDQQEDTLWQFKYSRMNGKDFYSVITQMPAQEMVMANGGVYTKSYQVYAGPNIRDEMAKASVGLENAVDYGWFHFIALPIFKMMMWFYDFTGNLGLDIILATIIIKLLLWPLAAKSYRSMAKLKEIQPEFLRVKEMHGDNREMAAMAMMKLYQEHKVNPMSGCWPMLIQIPIFFAFYKVILLSFEFRHAPFVFWLDDLSAKDPYFVLPVLMGATMYWQQKLNPPAADPIQDKVMKALPFIFTLMFMMFPAGLVLYWTTNNLLSVLQQWYIMRQTTIREVK